MIAAHPSVVLLTKNAGDLFGEVLDALFACRGIDSCELLMIDSGSTDHTLDLAAGYPQLQLHRILPAEFGHGRTRNLGAAMTTGDPIVYLVQDATPASADFLLSLIRPLDDERMAGVYGRQLPRPQTTPVERFFLEYTYPEQPEERALDPGEATPINSLFFSNVASAIRRSVWKKHPFDESLIMSEDQRWARDVMQAGLRIRYEPQAAVLHSHHYSLHQLFQRNFDSGNSLVGIAEDSFGRMLAFEGQFLAAAASHLTRVRQGHWIPYLLLSEAARSLGFVCGRYASFLPPRLKRALSLHKYHWDH